MKEKIVKFIKYIQKYAIWLIFLSAFDLLFILCLWLTDVRAFQALAVSVLLGSLLLFLLPLLFLLHAEQQREQAFLDFLTEPDERREEALGQMLCEQEAEMVRRLGTLLREQQQEQKRLSADQKDYEEYVESWAHEIKTPLSLLSFFLDNRRDELPPAAVSRLDYVRNRVQESVEQMLYFARTKGTQKDYLMEWLSLEDCCSEVLENYRPLLEENGFQTEQRIGGCSVFSDRRGLVFLLGQIVSNAVKYGKTSDTQSDMLREKESCVLRIWIEKNEEELSLHIRDNGMGVRSCDLPFIFEKGFTGDTGGMRKKATGMGLYLCRMIAVDLKIRLEVCSKWKEGFEMILYFPEIREVQREVSGQVMLPAVSADRMEVSG